MFGHEIYHEAEEIADVTTILELGRKPFGLAEVKYEICDEIIFYEYTSEKTPSDVSR